jgi:hypothetical protein
MGKGAELIFGPPGQPIPGVPTSDAVARKLGLDDPSGKSAQFGMYRSSYPVNLTADQVAVYPMISQELVAKLAEK